MRKGIVTNLVTVYSSGIFHKICDVIWENSPYVALGNFAEITKLILKPLYFRYFLLTLIIRNFGCRYHRGENRKALEKDF